MRFCSIQKCMCKSSLFIICLKQKTKEGKVLKYEKNKFKSKRKIFKRYYIGGINSNNYNSKYGLSGNTYWSSLHKVDGIVLDVFIFLIIVQEWKKAMYQIRKLCVLLQHFKRVLHNFSIYVKLYISNWLILYQSSWELKNCR